MQKKLTQNGIFWLLQLNRATPNSSTSLWLTPTSKVVNLDFGVTFPSQFFRSHWCAKQGSQLSYSLLLPSLGIWQVWFPRGDVPSTSLSDLISYTPMLSCSCAERSFCECSQLQWGDRTSQCRMERKCRYLRYLTEYVSESTFSGFTKAQRLI